MTLEELLTELDEWIESLGERLNADERLISEQLIMLDGNAVAGIIKTLQEARRRIGGGFTLFETDSTRALGDYLHRLESGADSASFGVKK